MFGLLYGLFMGGACAVDGIRKGLEDEKARQDSMHDFDGITYGTKGRSYYKGQLASYQTINGHNCIVSKNGKILKDYQQEKIDKLNRTNRAKWDEAIQEARDNGKKYFRFSRVFKTMEFKDRPSGVYELDTYKRINLSSNSDGKYYKVYDYVRKSEIKLSDIGTIKCGYYVSPDWSGSDVPKVEISKEEWEELYKIPGIYDLMKDMKELMTAFSDPIDD